MEPTGELVIFFCHEGFYPIQLSGLKPTSDEVPDHVALNAGTVRVESITGEVLWPPVVTQ